MIINIEGLAFFALIVGGIVCLFIKLYFPKYLNEKAKNLATKEDIKDITQQVESVKSTYAQLLEEKKSDFQLKFASVEREKNIKKEVYLDAVEAITHNQNIIPKFCNLSLPEQEITSCLSSNAGKIARVQIVGSYQTVKAVNEFMAAVGAETMSLILNRNKMILRISEIKTLENLQEQSGKEIDRNIELMKALNIEGNYDSLLWGKIKENNEFEQKNFDKYAAKISELVTLQNDEHLQYTKECMKKFYKVSRLIPEAVLAVRGELDLEISKDDYTKIFNENLEKAEKAFSNIVKEIEKKDILK